MSEVALINEDQRDCLQEITNVAMGQAADNLARLLDAFVILSIPHVEVLATNDMVMALQSLEDSNSVSGVCQGFIGGGISGEAMLIFNDASFTDLAELLNYEGEIDTQAEHELLMDTANVLNGACLKGIAEQLDSDFSFGPPMLLGQHCRITDLIKNNALSWERALVVEINYKIENRNVNVDLLLVMAEDSIDLLLKKLDIFLD
jgi:chemotaxis protein CheY-P-specific phosphatase CheC